jgi:8-oxo-dGTP pyrophosphatase MutT (NUDIX family)
VTVFVTASVCVLRDGALLTVRKRGTSRFMLPGGKLEPGESPVDCAVREAEEEIGLKLSATELTELGDWTSPAANEPDALVRSTVFLTPEGQPDPEPLGEIEELRWLTLGRRSPDLAPLLVEHVLPALEVGAP